jgi:Nucleotidyltransferase of unknown function (DUF6036)
MWAPRGVRAPVDRGRLEQLARRLAASTHARTTVYLTGGATAVIEGWRASTVDVDVRFEPDSDELLRALPRLKEELEINIELVSPPDFIPELPSWRDRSPLIFTEGTIEVRHFDPYSQALAKIERGFQQDLQDVRSMLMHGLIGEEQLREMYGSIESQLYRYPAIDPRAFRRKLDQALASDRDSEQ